MAERWAERWLDNAVMTVLVLAAWQVVSWVAGASALAPPLATLLRLGQMLGTADLWADIGETARAVGYAVLISIGAGLPLGMIFGLHRLSGEVSRPILLAFYALPKVTFYPLVLLFFGLGLSAKVALGVISGVVPIVLSTMSAVHHVRPSLLRTAKSFRLTPLQTIVTVLLPATLPEVLDGLRIGLSLTFVGVLIGEMFASQRGLGFLIMNSSRLHDVATTMAATLLVVVAALAVNGLLLECERRLTASDEHAGAKVDIG